MDRRRRGAEVRGVHAVITGADLGQLSAALLGDQLLQVHSEPSMRGRAMAVHSLVFLGSIPVGAVLVGLWCELLGPRAGMALAGGTALLAAVILLPRFRAMRSVAANPPRR